MGDKGEAMRREATWVPARGHTWLSSSSVGPSASNVGSHGHRPLLTPFLLATSALTRFPDTLRMGFLPRDFCFYSSSAWPQAMFLPPHQGPW